VAALIVGVLAADPAGARPAGEPHYPDLRTTTPSGMRIAVAPGVKRLFFSNTVWNGGPGPLELRAVNNATTGLTEAYQQIWTHAPDGTTQVYSERHVGTFVFHPAHGHWHFEDFARYELRKVRTNGNIGAVLRSTDKVSFCILESGVQSTATAHFGWGGSHACSATSPQGLKVGYRDTYDHTLPDQFIDVTGLPDGVYWLVSTVDPRSAELPRGRLYERDERNNKGKVKISIVGDTVTVVA
jgi:hypothetical protein